MGCGPISTGEYLIEPVVNDCGLRETPVNPNVLFDAKSTSVESPLFNVAEGEAVQLDAYSLCGGQAQVEKILLSQPNLPLLTDSCVCAVPGAPLAEELACKAMCNWILTDCASTRYITAQGTYRVRITEGMLGCAFIVMERLKRRDYTFPDGMVLQ